MNVGIQDQARHVDASEQQRQAAEEPVQIEDPVRARPATQDLGRQGQAPQHTACQQCPRDNAAAAVDVPHNCLFMTLPRSSSDGAGSSAPMSRRRTGEALQHAFDRFWRADPSRVGPKAGLGLSIVAAIAASHGGTATVANHPDGGAIFTVDLPVATGSAPVLVRTTEP